MKNHHLGTPLKVSINTFCKTLEERYEASCGGENFGLTLSDLVNRELCAGEVGVLVSAPGSGSTALLLRWLLMRTGQGLTCWHSPGLDGETAVMRLLSARTGIDLSRLRAGLLRMQDWPRVVEMLADIDSEERVIRIAEERVNLLRLQRELAVLPSADKDGLLLVLDDFLKLPSYSGEDFPFLLKILHSLGKIAGDHGVAILIGFKIRTPSSRDALATALANDPRSRELGPMLCLREENGCLALRVRGSTRALHADIPLRKIPSLGMVDEDR